MKKRNVLFFLVSSFLFLSISYFEHASGQSVVAPPIEWESQGSGFSVKQTSDGGCILFGDKQLVKVNSMGDIEWSQPFLISLNSGELTSDNGYILSSSSSIIKTDEIGNIQWERSFEEPDISYTFKSVKQSNDGGYVLAGWSVPIGINNNDFFLVKTDSSGNLQWKKTYGLESANEMAYDVLQSSDGGYLLVGETFRFDSQYTDGWVVKTNSNGNVLWSKTYGEPDPRGDWIYSVNPTKEGDFIMAGCGNRDPENNWQTGDFWLLQIDNSGNQQWSVLKGEYDRYEAASTVKQTNDGCYIAVGDIRNDNGIGDTWIIKIDPSDSSIVWDKIIEETGSLGSHNEDIIQTEDGGYAVVAGSLIKIMRANPPVSRFTYSLETPTVQQEILFDASDSFDLDEDIVSYRWDFSDGNITTTTTANISHSFELPRNYDVTLTVIDSEELNSTFSNEISIKINSSITLSTDTDTSYTGKPIEISGRLIDAKGNAIKNENVSIYYGDSRKENWTPLGYAITDSTGNFVSIWTPSNPKDYSIKSEWTGNQTFYGASNFTDVQILSNPVILSLSLSSTSTEFGFKIGINGSLTSNEVTLVGFPIHLSYSVTEGKTWNDISLKKTDSDGKYSVEWMPTATGDYLVRASWTGNSSYPRTETIADLVVLSFEENTVFSVASNSSISGLTFDSITNELKFNLSGVNGTKGYVDACISKTLIEDISDVQIYFDGTPIEFEFSSLENSWFLFFDYTHSTHEAIIFLSSASIPFNGSNSDVDSNWNTLPIVLVIIVILICGIVVYFSLRKRK